VHSASDSDRSTGYGQRYQPQRLISCWSPSIRIGANPAPERSRAPSKRRSGTSTARPVWRAGRSFAGQPERRAGISGARPATPIMASAAREVVVDLAGDVTLEDTDDLGFGAAFEESPLNVGACAWIGAHAGEHDAPQGVAGLTVAAPVEAMSGCLA